MRIWSQHDVLHEHNNNAFAYLVFQFVHPLHTLPKVALKSLPVYSAKYKLITHRTKIRHYAFIFHRAEHIKHVYLRRLWILNKRTPSSIWNRGQPTSATAKWLLHLFPFCWLKVSLLPNEENVNTVSAKLSRSSPSLWAYHLPVKERYFIFVWIELSCSPHRLCFRTSQQQQPWFNMCRVYVILSAFSPWGLREKKREDRERDWTFPPPAREKKRNKSR